MQRNVFSQKPRKERAQREARRGGMNGEEAVDGSDSFSAVEREPEISPQLCTSLKAFSMPTPPHRIRTGGADRQTASWS